jgi:methylase of polypeptide subunit release factors
MTSLSAALTLVALALVLFHPYPARTVRAADINEKCADCTARNAQRYEQCIAIHGETDQRCGEQYNEGVVHCFRNFCEQ